MQLFVTSPDQQECVKELDLRRLNKAILETTQMLSTTSSIAGFPAPYRPTHINHPVSKWVRSTRLTYFWTYLYLQYACEEYTSRTGKTHACEQHLESLWFVVSALPCSTNLTFCNCTPYKTMDVFEAYKKYLRGKQEADTLKARRI